MHFYERDFRPDNRAHRFDNEMLPRRRELGRVLLLMALGACAADVDPADNAEYLEVSIEVPEGSGPEPVSAEDKEECTTSCSLAKHPVPPFTELGFEQVRARYAAADPEHEGQDLETLLFYGPRTEELFDALGYGELSTRHQAVLRRELSRRSARVSLRLVGEKDNKVQAAYGPSLVPIGKKQHLATVGEGLLAMEFNGTVMRTGVNYLWSRY